MNGIGGEKQTLAAIHRQIEDKTAALIEEKQAYQAARETLSHAHQSQCIDHQTLKGWLGQEKSALSVTRSKPVRAA
ncbi:hypothetical protein P4S72_10690 [Vibrio sp. PP-XX7]